MVVKPVKRLLLCFSVSFSNLDLTMHNVQCTFLYLLTYRNVPLIILLLAYNSKQLCHLSGVGKRDLANHNPNEHDLVKQAREKRNKKRC